MKPMKPMKTMKKKMSRLGPRRGLARPLHSSMDDDEECLGLRFFRLLLQPDFSSKLMLPRAFCKHFIKKRSRVGVTLVSSNGKLWHADLYKENGDIYMGGEGWSDCIKANDIKFGFVLIMCYKGRKIFSFRVFDFSSFEIQNPVIKRRLITEQQNNGNSMEDSYREETGHTGRRSCCSMKTSFEVTFKKYIFVARVLTIPLVFRRASGLTEEHKEVSIVGRDGITRHVGLSHQGRSMRLSKGWTRFIHENGIDVGHRVRFELVSATSDKNKVAKMRMVMLQTSCAKNPDMVEEMDIEDDNQSEDQIHFDDDSDDDQSHFDDDSDQ